jgi:hypothetical protein
VGEKGRGQKLRYEARIRCALQAHRSSGLKPLYTLVDFIRAGTLLKAKGEEDGVGTKEDEGAEDAADMVDVEDAELGR